MSLEGLGAFSTAPSRDGHKEKDVPTFEYKCNHCGQKSEKLFLPPKKVEEQIVCPICEVGTASKIFSPFEIRGVFKWYKSTDFGKGAR